MTWAPDYCSVDALSSYRGIDDTVDEAELALSVTAASRAVDQETGRQFGSVAAEERVYTARPDYERGYWVVDIDDVMDATGMTVTIDGDTVATYQLEPRNAPQKGRPWTRIVFTSDSEHKPSRGDHEVAVVAPWGWTEFPGTVVEATKLQANRWATRRDAPFGVAGSPDVGSEVRLLAKVDPDVAVALRPYRRIRSPR